MIALTSAQALVILRFRMMIEEHVLALDSPVGMLELRGTDRGVTGVRFADRRPKEGTGTPDSLLLCRRELDAYFRGTLRRFTVPLVMRSTDFQQAVWDALLEIGFGNTISYGALAEAAKYPRAARAVGTAVGDNPFAIIVPCHRVLPADRTLGHYASGPERKAWLLRHEGIALA